MNKQRFNIRLFLALYRRASHDQKSFVVDRVLYQTKKLQPSFRTPSQMPPRKSAKFEFTTAPTDRAACNICFALIAKDTSKLSYSSKKSAHLNCIKRDLYENMMEAFGSLDKVPGFNQLSSASQLILKKFESKEQ